MKRLFPNLDRSARAVRWMVLAVLLAAVMPSPTGGQIVLQLQNGDRVTGALVSETLETLILSNAWNQAISIQKDRITRRLESTNLASLARQDQPGTNAPPGITATNHPAKSKWFSNWKGEFQAGADLHKGELNSELYHIRLKLEHHKDRLRNLFDMGMAYGKTDGNLSANRWDGSWKTGFDVGHKLFVYNYFDSGFDEIRKIDLRFQDGPGVGYYVLSHTNLVLDVESGANYEREYRSDNTVRDAFAVRLAESLTWKPLDRLILEEKFDYYPRFTQVDDFRFKLELSAKYLLNKSLSINLSVLDVYERTPAAGVVPNDLQIRSSIGVLF